MVKIRDDKILLDKLIKKTITLASYEFRTINVKELRQKLLTSNDSDENILIDVIKKSRKIPNKTKDNYDDSGRQYWKTECLKKWLPSAKNSGKKYLDYGGGRGDITYHIAKEYNTSPELAEVYTPQIHEGVILHKIDTSKQQLPFADNQYNMITSFMVFHHVPTFDNLIKELNRIMKKTGALYIQEHDCVSAVHAQFLDLIHLIYGAFSDENENKSLSFTERIDKLEPVRDTHYFGKDELVKIITNAGFTLMNSTVPYGPQRPYFAIFKKN